MNRMLFLTGSIKRSKQVLFIAAILFLGFSETIKAQAPTLKYQVRGIQNDSVVWHLTGKVTDQKNGSYLNNCTIYVRTSDRKKVIAKVITNADGTFECNIVTLRKETVNLLFRRSNFLPVEIPAFNPGSGKLEVMMEPDPKARSWKANTLGGCPSF